ncbi:lactate utilization protein [Anaerofustis butyriciformans]|uniref:lactate utilization protein n=1 Tax=Anaerofustis butyriciformans TaxID=3108533 RepID=UPI003F896FDB
MDYIGSIKKINEKKILTTIKALKKNNIDARLFDSKDELLNAVKELIPEGSTTAMGGSYTIKQVEGLSELIQSYDFKDRKKEANSKEEARKIAMEANFVDYYFMSSNAITVSGELYNVDGTGNRVSALIYGPEHVIIIASPNKIVSSVDAAIDRVKEQTGPMNCERLDMKTPCRELGRCANCKSDDKICIFYTLTGYQKNKDRIKVFFLNDDNLGL